MKAWQLQRISTGESLTEPGPLPVNWGPIFGLSGVEEKLADLSWLGESYADMAWVQLNEDVVDNSVPLADMEWIKAKARLATSDWSVLPDVPMTAGKKSEWIEYRAALRNIRSQVGFPNQIEWPSEPSN